MDPLTQAALGASVGGVVAGRKLGLGRALAWGAVAGALPDIDLLANIGDDPFLNLRHHRGVTHALWFAPVFGSALGWLLWRWRRRAGPDPGWAPWVRLMMLSMLSHPLLDLFTHYGTQLWAPFSDQRFALPAVPAVDPAYTSILLLGLIGAWIGRQRFRQVLGVALMVSTAYLGVGLACNVRVETQVRQQLVEEGVVFERVGVFPTFMQLPLRRVVVVGGGEVRVGFVSAWRACRVEWGPVGRLPSAAELAALLKTEQGRTFAWFTNRWLAVATAGGANLRYSDLRFGFSREPAEGLWSVTLNLDPATVPVYANQRPTFDWQTVAELFAAAFPSGCAVWRGRSPAPV